MSLLFCGLLIKIFMRFSLAYVNNWDIILLLRTFYKGFEKKEEGVVSLENI